MEADRIGGGVTKNTTAKITSQHGLIYDKLLRNLGAERAHLYLEANQQALERYRELYELRERGPRAGAGHLYHRPNGEVILLHGFIKRQSRDTMQALEQSLNILARLREQPELAMEYIVKEEKP